ncbi:MAG: glycosyltransferase family 4 protein [Pyrinomonadaceae bacterium]
MLVGIDAIPLIQPKTGIGHYTFELANALARYKSTDEIRLLSPATLAPPQIDSNELPFNLIAEQVAVGPVTRKWFSLGLPRYAKRTKLDVFHGTNYDIPLWHACPTVVTIHDLSLLLHPEYQSKRVVLRARRRLPIMSRAATGIIVPTNSIKDEVCERLRVPSQKVHVVPEAARDIFHEVTSKEIESVRTRFGIRDQFIFTVGTIEPRKNYLMLIRSFERLRQLKTDCRMQLVIAGSIGRGSQEVLRLINESAVCDDIVLTGYLEDLALRALYTSCRLFVYPSFYEGFGLPPLEAMRCGVPVIATSTAAVAEVVGDAARLVDPTSEDQLLQSLLEVAFNDEVRRSLTERGRTRVALLSWEHTAELTREVYLKVLSQYNK